MERQETISKCSRTSSMTRRSRLTTSFWIEHDGSCGQAHAMIMPLVSHISTRALTHSGFTHHCLHVLERLLIGEAEGVLRSVSHALLLLLCVRGHSFLHRCKEEMRVAIFSPVALSYDCRLCGLRRKWNKRSSK